MASLLVEILEFPFLLFGLAVSAAGFSADAFQRASTSAEAESAALIIAFLAGMSEMLGQSVILVVNRIALYRFIASLLFTGATYLVTVLTWGLCALAVAPLTGKDGPLLTDAAGVIGVVSLAFAPRLLGVFSIAPYFGAAFANLLEVWAMALAVFGLTVAFDMPLGAALFCGGAGWIASYALRSFLGHALAKPLGHLRVFITGSPLDRTPQQLVDDVVSAIRRETKP